MEDILLDNKYIVEKFKGNGGYSKVFLVKEINSQKEYAAKILTKVSRASTNELDICNIIKNKIKDNTYIIDFITHGNGSIQKDKKIKINQNYYIFSYASKGDLWQYILEGGFKEVYCKIIFEKILKGVQLLHNIGICHRDINPNNILLDDNFNPKICDFGFSTPIKKDDDKLYDILGTSIYKPPQMYIKNTPYNGKKADIFSLGVTLFVLLTKKPCFLAASRKDKYYRNIMDNHKAYQHYFKKIIQNDTSDLFFKLFFKLVEFDEKERPKDIKEILDHEWFDQIKQLNNDDRMILEEQVRLEFQKRENEINKKVKLDLIVSLEKRIFERNQNKSFFENDINPKLINIEPKMDNYIRIKGNLNPSEFMNNLAKELNYLYSYEIQESKKNLKFNCIIKKIENNIENDDYDDDELDFENCNYLDKDCIIQVKLFKLNSVEFLLRFIKKEGTKNDYYTHLLTIIKEAKNLI